MRIVILDAFTANPGDLSWAKFHPIGNCEIHDRTRPDEIVSRARGAEIILTNKTPLDRATLADLPGLRYIGVLATGYNVVDVVAARDLGIVVCNVPEYGTANVAQSVFALLLELTNRVGHHADTVAGGRWCASPDFCYWDFPLIELKGLTIGIVGLGCIGRAVASIAHGFGMHVLATSRRRPPALHDYIHTTDLDALFAGSDVISLHCPLTPETEKMVGGVRLATMKASAFLINTSRGGLIDEFDLAAALNEGRLAGAGLDVLTIEPPRPDNPLLHAKNCLITPHIAWATQAARARLIHRSAANLRGFLDGHQTNRVS